MRLQKYGDYFLEALRPYGASLKAAHESAKVEAARIEAGEEESDEEDVPLALRRQRKACAEAAERRLAEARPAASEVVEVEDEDEDEEVKEVEEVEVVEEEEDPHMPIPESVDDLFHHELPYFHELVEWKRARGERQPCLQNCTCKTTYCELCC